VVFPSRAPNLRTPRPENHELPKTGIPNRKKSALNTALSCELDYFNAPTSPLATGDSEFFTDDLLERQPAKVAAVALANKLARMAWAVMGRGFASPKETASHREASK
jgi:hypothetical protein